MFFASFVRLLFVLLLLLAADAAAEHRVYRVERRDAAELVPIAEVIVADRGTVAVDVRTNSLILVGPSEVIEEALRIVEQQDRAVRSIVVRYGVATRAQIEALGWSIRWSVDQGAVKIGNAIAPGGGPQVSLRSSAGTRAGDLELGGTLRMQEGSRSSIDVGTAVPYRTRRGRATSTEWVSADTGFRSRARVLDDGSVRLELAGLRQQISPDGTIARSSLNTTVELAPGETKVIGSLSRHADASGRVLAGGSARGTSSEDELLLLRVELE